jgi:hypothetical protein
VKYSKPIATVLLAAALLGAACAAPPKEVPPSQASAPATSTAASNPGTASSIPAPPTQTNVKWTPPARWKAGAERPMRAATYQIPAAAGDSEDAECAVFVNIGGGVQANVDRWIGQFEQADGSASKDKAKTKQETINGMPVTIIDLSGTYKGGGVAMGQPSAPKTGYRLLGAIAEAPGGLVYFKLTGPAKTVAAAQSEFQTMLKSLK